jgi:DNA-directed RNA polymerase II subunit RPB1
MSNRSSHIPHFAPTAAVEIWYDPDPSSTIIEDNSVFVESFFAIPDEEIDSKLHLQSPWLLRLELDRAKMIDRKLTMHYVVGRIAESFKTDLFVIWSEDNSEKLIIRCRVLGSPDKVEDLSMEEDIFLRSLENTMLNSVSLLGVKGIKRVFMTEPDKITISPEGNIVQGKEKEWVLETDGVNLKTVMCIDGVDFKRTYSNSCIEIFNVLSIEAARAAIMKELRGVIEFDGSYVNYRHLALLCDLMTRLLAHIAELCSTITIWRCYLTFWDISICNVSILRSLKRTDFSNVFSNVFSNISCTQPYSFRYCIPRTRNISIEIGCNLLLKFLP